jgi:hypothetical protein
MMAMSISKSAGALPNSPSSYQPSSQLRPFVPLQKRRTLSKRTSSLPCFENACHASNSSVSSSISSSESLHGTGGNAIIQVTQRSHGASVKAVIDNLRDKCHEQSERLGEEAPVQECVLLYHWSVDAYYKVVISKYLGIPAIVSAMRAFPEVEDLQTACCGALKNLNNKVAIQEAGGVSVMLLAMHNHPQSIDVQSEACEALRSQGPLLQQDPAVVATLGPMLEQAREMYLTRKGRESLLFLLTVCSQ